ncbi:MAG: Rab family GTPase, partial [Candidatus Odinarchaeota archaeon]
GAFGALIVFDLTRHQTFISMKEWLSEMRSIISRDIPSAIIGNKTDLVPEVGQIIDKNEVEEYAKKHDCIYVETSAKTGENVEKAFLDLTYRMIKRMGKIVKNSKENL